jgi:hypothetical protein
MTPAEADQHDDEVMHVLAEAAAARRSKAPPEPPTVSPAERQGLLNAFRSFFMSLQDPEAVPAQLLMVHEIGEEIDAADVAVREQYARGNTGPESEEKLRELLELRSATIEGAANIAGDLMPDFSAGPDVPHPHTSTHGPSGKRGAGTGPEPAPRQPHTPPAPPHSPPSAPLSAPSPEPFVAIPHADSPSGALIKKLDPVPLKTKQRRKGSLDDGRSARPNSMLDPSRTSGNTAEPPIPEGTSIRSWKTQGREEREETLEMFLNDPNQPAHVLGWLRNEQRRLASGNGQQCTATPPGYVLGHLPGKRASEGYDYTNSTLVTEDINQLETRSFPKWLKQVEARKQGR